MDESPTYICIDLETTGLHANEHGICQIGAVALVNGERLRLSSDINPLPCNIAPQALEVNKFTLDRIKAGRTLDEGLSILADFLLSLTNPVLVFHNAPFDTEFLKAGFRRLSPVALNEIRASYNARGVVLGGLKFEDHMPGMRRVIDTVAMGFALLPYLENLPSLATLVAELGIDARSWKAHDALSDAEILADVFEALMNQRARNDKLREALASSVIDHIESPREHLDQNYFAAGYEMAACDFLDILENPDND